MAYIIQIGTKGDTSGVDKVDKALKDATGAAASFIDTLKAGVGIDIGGQIVQKLQDIPRVIEEGILRGINFNATLENTATAVAAVLEKFQGLSRDKAITTASAAVEELKRQAINAPGTISQLSEAWIASAGAASAANIPLNQQIDLMVKLSQACSRLSLPQQQLTQETRALLTGNITLDAQLAKTIGATNESIRVAKTQGDLYGYLVGRIGALGEASDTYEVRLSNFNDTLDQVLGELTKPIFDQLRDSILDLNKAISDPATVEELKNLGFEVASLVKGGAALTEWAIRNAPALAMVAKAGGTLAVAIAEIKIVQVLPGLAAWTLGLNKSTTALDAESAALARNTALQSGNAASRATNVAATVAAAPVGAGGIYAEYKTARTKGMNATAAFREAKGNDELARLTASQNKSMTDATAQLAKLRKEAELNTSAFAKLRTNLTTFAGVGTLGQAATGLSIVAIVTAVSEAIRSSQRADIDRQTSEGNTRLKSQANLTKRAGALTSEDDRKSLLADIDTALEGAKGNEPLRKYLGELYGRVREMPGENFTASPEKVAANEAEIEATAKLREKNFQLQQAASERSLANTRDKQVQTAIDSAAAAKNPAALDKTLKDLDAKLAAASASAAQPDNPNLERDLGDQQQYMELIERVREARKDIEKDVADEAEKNAEKAKEKRIKDLEEQKELIAAQGDEQLAQLELQNKKGQDNAKARLAIEDEIARKRLDLENQIGTLQEESATAREAREVQYRAAQLSREANARASAAEATNLATGRYDAGDGRIATAGGTSRKYGVRGASYDINGNLTGGTRGGAPVSPSDLSAINAAEGRGMSALDRFKNSQPGMPGYTPIVPPSTVPSIAQPGSQVAGQDGSSNASGDTGAGGAADAAKGLVDEAKKLNEQLKSVLEEATALTAEAAGQLPALANNIRDVKARVKALERANS